MDFLLSNYETLTTIYDMSKDLNTFRLDSGILMEVVPDLSVDHAKVTIKLTF
jgi:hypothetical protein